MNEPNIYELMKVSKNLDLLVEETGTNPESESTNVGLWILGGVIVLGLVYYWNYEDLNEKKQISFK